MTTAARSRPSVAKTEMAASFITEATFSRTSGEKNRSVAELIASPTAVSILTAFLLGPRRIGPQFLPNFGEQLAYRRAAREPSGELA